MRANLKAAGKETELVKFEDGTRVLILPHGGRVLGLFARDDQDLNFLWTHQALTDPASTRALFEKTRWPNPGGDRTWLAPSWDLFVSDLTQLWQTYVEPKSVDPGNYTYALINGEAHLRNRAAVKLLQSHGEATVEIAKTIAPAMNPLRAEKNAPPHLQFAGFTTSVSLAIKSDPNLARAPIGLWQLLQMPPNGEMFVRTFYESQPRVVFGDIASGHLTWNEDFARYRMCDRTRTHKIALRAVATTGRAGYVYRSESSDRLNLVIRNFSVNPSGHYVDPPFDDLQDLGYSFQACNVAENDIGHFAEMEHHVPAIGPTTGKLDSLDVSQVWAFRGGAEEILTAGRMLLGHCFSIDKVLNSDC